MKKILLPSLALLVSAATLLSSFEANAELSRQPDFSSQETVASWIKMYASHARKSRKPKTYSECRSVSELKGATLCQFSSRDALQAALLRASLFIEGVEGTPKGSILLRSSDAYKIAAAHVVGIDLTGEDLLDFYEVVAKKCVESKNDPEICLTSSEAEIFEKLILPAATKQEPFVLIAFAQRPVENARGVVSHEIMHAQYFLQPKFRSVIDTFWSQTLNDAQRAYIRSMLLGYDVSNDLLMRNEFQAYLLQFGSENGFLSPIIEKLRPRVVSALAEEGILPIQIR